MGKHTSKNAVGVGQFLLAWATYIENPYNSYWRGKRKLIKNIWRKKCFFFQLFPHWGIEQQPSGFFMLQSEDFFTFFKKVYIKNAYIDWDILFQSFFFAYKMWRRHDLFHPKRCISTSLLAVGETWRKICTFFF